jgi:hypothetical protein
MNKPQMIVNGHWVDAIINNRANVSEDILNFFRQLSSKSDIDGKIEVCVEY